MCSSPSWSRNAGRCLAELTRSFHADQGPNADTEAIRNAHERAECDVHRPSFDRLQTLVAKVAARGASLLRQPGSLTSVSNATAQLSECNSDRPNGHDIYESTLVEPQHPIKLGCSKKAVAHDGGLSSKKSENTDAVHI